MIDQKRYDEIAKVIHSDTSPVGIDAKKTHILILAKLEDMAKEIAEIKAGLDKLKS